MNDGFKMRVDTCSSSELSENCAAKPKNESSMIPINFVHKSLVSSS